MAVAAVAAWIGGTLAQTSEAYDLYRRGTEYFQGISLGRDYEKAADYYRQSAGMGYARAQVMLGRMYHEGYGLPKSHPDALLWYRRAAEQGEVRAQALLGKMLMDGDGKDGLQAYVWLKLASQRGDFEARDLLRRIAPTLSPDQLRQADQRVQGWQPAPEAQR